MAATDSGAIGTLTLISAEEVDPDETGTVKWLRVRFSLDVTSATEALVGFRFWHDDAAGVTVPVWVDAVDSVNVTGDGGDPVQVYETLVAVPLSAQVLTWWETFTEYASSDPAGVLDEGGSGWSGAWLVKDNEIGFVGYRDTFDSYATGTVGTLNGGRGFSGAWVIEANG